MNNPFETIDARLANIECLLTELKRSHFLRLVKSDSDELLTLQEAAEMLSVSPQTMYGRVRRSEIPVSKKGKRLYFSREELTNWVKTGRKKTVAELEQEANEFLINRKGIKRVK